MTRQVLTVTPHCTMDDCMAIMTDHRVRHLPVLSDAGVAGIVSIGDVVKACSTSSVSPSSSSSTTSRQVEAEPRCLVPAAGADAAG